MISNYVRESESITRDGQIWVEFKGHRRSMFSNPFEFPFHIGDIAIVEADRGEDAGEVKHVIDKIIHNDAKPAEFAVIRRATTKDMDRVGELRNYEEDALTTCTEKIELYNLPMNLIDAEYRFDGLKLIFYFTSDGRVDFRELVRDLAGTFRTRIELRQIGSRDEVKRFEGFGVCGYRLCCVSFMKSFQPITTQIAKAQNLILNPSKLSGLCGKLKCCLAFEADYYDIVERDQQLENTIETDNQEKDLNNLSD